MTQNRWLIKRAEFINIEDEAHYYDEEPVLQQRSLTPLGLKAYINGHPTDADNLWSEWMDIPTVYENEEE